MIKSFLQLVEAVIKGDVSAVRKCLADKKLNVNELVKAENGYGRPAIVALSDECKADDKTRCEIAQLLLNAGARLDVRDELFGRSALQQDQSSAALLRLFLSAEPRPDVNNADNGGETPLHRHEFGPLKCHMLIEAKANVNAVNNDGNTPLMDCVRFGGYQSIPIFLAAGAKLDIKNKRGKTALTIGDVDDEDSNTCNEIIRKYQEQKLYEYMFVVCFFSFCVYSLMFRSRKPSVVDIYVAMVKDDIAALKKCLSVPGLDVDALFKDSGFPESAFVSLARLSIEDEMKTVVEMAQLLIDAGAKRDLPDKNGDTALHWASAPLLKFLLSTKPPLNVNVKNNYGSTPLHQHACEGRVECCEVLIEAKADVNAVDESEFTPLMWAVRYGESKVVTVLLEAGADVNVKNKEGNTAMTCGDEDEKTAACKEIIKKHLAAGGLRSRISQLEQDRQQLQQDRAKEHARVEELEKRLAGLTAQRQPTTTTTTTTPTTSTATMAVAVAVAEIAEQDLKPIRLLARGKFKVAWLCDWNGMQVVKLEIEPV